MMSGGLGVVMDSIQLTDDNNSTFAKHLIERLERVGIFVHSSNGLHIVCWEGGQSVDCDLLIRPSTVTSDYLSCSQCEIVIHDLYVPGGSNGWGPNDIDDYLDWLSNPLGNSPKGGSRYWVHIRDVVDMIVQLIDCLPNGRIDVCGRRCWTNDEMGNELDMLYSRTMAAQNQSFQLENLKNHHPSIEYIGVSERPDLAPLHSALQLVDDYGWRPRVPFRIGLMECIAHRLT